MNGTQRTCRHCGRAIVEDYFVAGYEVNEGGVPVNVYVHQGCRAGFVVAQQRREQLQAVAVRVFP